MSSRVKFAEVAEAINAGADEIDLVCSRKLFYEKKYEEFFHEVYQSKKLCLEKNVHLKVILETGELIGPHDIYLASMLCLHAGADFIKTSTGKVTPSATIDSSIVMAMAIRDFGKRRGFKPAGGIRTLEDAISYYMVIKLILGDEFLTPDLFRIGASSLLHDFIQHLD